MNVNSLSKSVAYGAALTSSLCYSGSVATAQLLGEILPRFEMNVVRFVSQFLLCSSVALALRRNPLHLIHRRDVISIFLGAFAYTSCVLTINLAPLYIPVGNMESVAIVLFVLLAIANAIVKRRATVAIVVAGVISSVGVAMLIQPEFIFGGSKHNNSENDPCPCLSLTSSHDADLDNAVRPQQCLRQTRRPSTKIGRAHV